MISELLAILTPAYVAGVALVGSLIIQIIVRVNYAQKFKRAGGVHAPKLAHDPFTCKEPIGKERGEMLLTELQL
jgi:hypothetical protein